MKPNTSVPWFDTMSSSSIVGYFTVTLLHCKNSVLSVEEKLYFLYFFNLLKLALGLLLALLCVRQHYDKSTLNCMDNFEDFIFVHKLTALTCSCDLNVSLFL